MKVFTCEINRQHKELSQHTVPQYNILLVWLLSLLKFDFLGITAKIFQEEQ